MLDIGGSELLVVAVVALLVVGPKELPGLLRTVGRAIGAVKRQAQEFRAQFDEVIRDTEFEDLQKSVNEMKMEAEAGIRDFGSALEKEVGEVEGAGKKLSSDISDYDPAKQSSDAKLETSEEEYDHEWVADYERSIEEAKAGPTDVPSDASMDGPSGDQSDSRSSALASSSQMTGKPLSKETGHSDAAVAPKASKTAGAAT